MFTIKFKHITYLGVTILLYWLYSHIGFKTENVSIKCLDKGVISSMYGHPVFYVVLQCKGETRTIEDYEADYFIHYKVGHQYTKKQQSLYWIK